MQWTCAAVLLAAVVLRAGVGWAQQPDEGGGSEGVGEGEEVRSLVVGTKVAPPFVTLSEDGQWGGLSIDLWRSIAEGLGVAYRLEERTLEGLIDGLAAGELDVSIAALTVTAEREERVDFSHPYYTSGLGIAVRMGDRPGWLAVVARVFSWQFVLVVGSLAVLLFAVGVAVWLVERRANPEQFGGKASAGIAAAFWWAAVTMTTVGYGDMAPRTALGRMFGLVWMFAAIIIISFFTASITSSLTVGELDSRVSGPDDLGRVRVAAVTGTTGRQFLTARGINHRSVEDVAEAITRLRRGEVDAVVYDAPILQDLVREEGDGLLRVLSTTLEPQDYAIGLRLDSPLRKDVNRELLSVTESEDWAESIAEYFGADR